MMKRLEIPALLAACAFLASCIGGENSRQQVRTERPASGTRPAAPQQVITAERPQKSPAPRAEFPPTGAHYRVLKTDTTRSIAMKFYGDERYAEDILELNSETIRRARGLKPGMVILLPPVNVHDSVARP